MSIHDKMGGIVYSAEYLIMLSSQSIQYISVHLHRSLSFIGIAHKRKETYHQRIFSPEIIISFGKLLKFPTINKFRHFVSNCFNIVCKGGDNPYATPPCIALSTPRNFLITTPQTIIIQQNFVCMKCAEKGLTRLINYLIDVIDSNKDHIFLLLEFRK